MCALGRDCGGGNPISAGTGLGVGLLLVACISLVGADLEVLEAGALRRTSALQEYRREARQALKRFMGHCPKYPPLLPPAALNSIGRLNIRSMSHH
jgi:hypothetical protein